MRQIIHKVRKQPEETRRHILHALTFIVAVIFLAFWIFSLRTSFFDPSTKAKATNDLRPFAELKASIVDGYYNLSGREEETQ